uniref:Uncharacterized protein n=1 Tax=Arundo donax TaxID=35708 RepID=A0A0A9HIW9_ARUDO
MLAFAPHGASFLVLWCYWCTHALILDNPPWSSISLESGDHLALTLVRSWHIEF